MGGLRGGDLVRPGVLDADAAVGGHKVGVRPLGPVGVAARASRGALEVDEPTVASADGLQEPSEVASGPVCHGAQCAPLVDGGVRLASSGVRGRAQRSLLAGNNPCKSSARTASTWQNPSMGKNASFDGRHLLVVLVQSSHSLEVEFKIRKRDHFLKLGRRAVARVIHRLSICCKPLHVKGRRMLDQLHTQRIVMGVRAEANPVVAAFFAVFLLSYLVFVVVSVILRSGSNDQLTFWVNPLVDGLESWRTAVRVHLLDDGKQSPIGDYLALQAVTIFLAEVGERRLRKIPNVVQETTQQRMVRLRRGMYVVAVLIANLLLTVLISYGFLSPFPGGSLGVFYVGLAGFVFVAGVWRSLLGVNKAFPASPELIRKAIKNTRRRSLLLRQQAQWRRIELREKSQAATRKFCAGQRRHSGLVRMPTSKRVLRDGWQDLKWKVRQFRATDPRCSLGRRTAVALALRFVLGVGVSLAVTLMATYLRNLFLMVDLAVQWAAFLIVLGLLDTLFIHLGAFRRNSVGDSVMTLVAVMFNFAMYALFIGVRIQVASDYRVGVLQLSAGIVAALLLFGVEVFCIFLAFEMRDFSLVSSVREERIFAHKADLLQKYLHKKWPRECGSPHGVIGRGRRRAFRCGGSTKMFRAHKID